MYLERYRTCSKIRSSKIRLDELSECSVRRTRRRWSGRTYTYPTHPVDTYSKTKATAHACCKGTETAQHLLSRCGRPLWVRELSLLLYIVNLKVPNFVFAIASQSHNDSTITYANAARKWSQPLRLEIHKRCGIVSSPCSGPTGRITPLTLAGHRPFALQIGSPAASGGLLRRLAG